MKTPAIDFGDGIELKEDLYVSHKIIRDRKSVFSVAVGKVHNENEIKDFLKKVKALKNHHKATHHSWAARLKRDGAIHESKKDDGETGAGNVILRMIQKTNNVNAIVCVIRWFGGVKLHADRFKHIQDAALYGLESANGNRVYVNK